jgi:pimeloyl-ACP methyl ester carboxylesterase
MAAGVLLAGALAVHARFSADVSAAAGRAAEGSRLVETRCGPIEMQEAGDGPALLVIHGSGGGHDQGMAWARPLAQRGLRVVAVSRFGYLRTPRPDDASPEAQADAHVCLLDALGIAKAAVAGISAGAPSAMQAAIRHPERVGALVLIVPIAHRPETVAPSARPVSDLEDELLLRLLGSDFLFWSALKLARDQVLRHVLATPPALVSAASQAEGSRIDEIVGRILPVSARAAGLRDDTRLGKTLGPYPLESIGAPTLVVSARDDGFGTYATARHIAARIPEARFVGFETGAHLLVGRSAAVQAEVLEIAFGSLAR